VPAGPSPEAGPAAAMRELQRAVGNRAVSRMAEQGAAPLYLVDGLGNRRVQRLRVQERAARQVARDTKRESDMPDYAGDPRAPLPKPPPAPHMVFESPTAWDPVSAPDAFRDYGLLKADEKKMAFEISYPNGNLSKALAALGSTNAADDKYAASVRELLRWVEETETRKASGTNDAGMAETQAGFLKSDPTVVKGGWGGAKTKTRWELLLAPAQAAWTTRGKAAIIKMVAHAQGAAPELKLKEETFELKFHELDKISLKALAAGGSQPGKTVTVGFEFVAEVEVNPAYALSTVVHELGGHPVYDGTDGGTYGGALYQQSAAAAKKKGVKLADMKGAETYNYFQSEIYSLLKELPYWTEVTKADQGKRLDVGGAQATPEGLNYNPRKGIVTEIDEVKAKWEPSLGLALLHGFYQRIKMDPTMKPFSIAEFEKLIRQEFTDADAADKILK
jgi:hypothetical protein